MPDLLVVGRHIRLRELSAEDTDFVVAWRNHPEIQHWLPSWAPLTAESHNAWLAGCRERGDLVLAYLDPDGKIVGQGSLYSFDPLQRNAEFGRVFFALEHGNPFAVLESYYLTHALGLEVLGLSRIYAHTVTENVRAEKLLLNLGYQQEGLHRAHLWTPWGQCRDVRSMALFPESFRGEALRKTLYKGQAPELDGPAVQQWLGQHQARRAKIRSGPTVIAC